MVSFYMRFSPNAELAQFVVRLLHLVPLPMLLLAFKRIVLRQTDRGSIQRATKNNNMPKVSFENTVFKYKSQLRLSFPWFTGRSRRLTRAEADTL